MTKKHPLAVRILLFPVHYPVHLLHKVFPHNRKISHSIVGIGIALLGTYLAQHHALACLPHFLADFTYYGIHGIGLAPFAKVVFEVFDVEA